TNEGAVNDVFSFEPSPAANSPYFDVIYQPQTGQPGYYTYFSQRLSDRMSLGVNVASGNLLVRNSDLVIPGTAGFDETVEHYFNAHWERNNQDVGTGWTTSLGPDVKLRFLPDGSAVFDG